MARSRKTYEQCVAEIRKAGGDRSLTDADVLTVIEEIDRRAALKRAQKNAGNAADAILEAADDMGRDLQAALDIERRNRWLAIAARTELFKRVADADRIKGDPSLGLRSATVGVNSNIPNGRQSAAARQQAIFTGWMGGLVTDLKRANLLAVFNSRAAERELAVELAEISKGPNGRPGLSGSSDARRMAEIVDVYRRASIGRQNRAGAWIRPLPGYVVKQTHDPAAMRKAGFAAWRDRILPLLDPKTFDNVDDVPDFMQRSYDALVSGIHRTAQGADDSDLLYAFKGPGSLAKKASQHRVLHFKDADAFMAYNAEFGTRNLTDAIVQDLKLAADNAGLMEVFGPNPRAMWDDLRSKIESKYRGDAKKLARLQQASVGYQFDQVEGQTNRAVNPNGAEISGLIRAVESMAKLGGAVLSSVQDLAAMAATTRRATGTSMLDAWGKTLSAMVEGMKPGEARQTSDLIGAGIDGMVGNIAARFSVDDSLPGTASKAMRLFFKLNLLEFWTDANKRGIGLMMSRHLGMESAGRWADLKPETRDGLARFGMDATRWEIVRRAARQEADGRIHLTPDAINDLPDVAFHELTGGKTGRGLRGIKDELSTAVRSYILDVVDEAIPSPGARERALLMQGTRPGTIVGEAVRFIAQFKAFPITVLTKQMGRGLEVDTTRDFFRALASGKGDIRGLAHFMVASTVLGYVAMSAKEIAKGRTPRDPADPATWQAAMLQGGGLGIYGDFLFGEYNRFGRGLLDTIAGPTLGSVGDLAELWAKFRSGEDTAASTVRLLVSNTPFANLFYTRAALDYLFLYELQESINPGYLRRMERRIQRENGQTFILPPSGVVR